MKSIDDFEKYKIRKNHYEGILNEKTISSDYLKAFWCVNGEGRAITAAIQVESGGKIIKSRVWSYDSMIEWKRKRNHEKMMLEALIWATT